MNAFGVDFFELDSAVTTGDGVLAAARAVGVRAASMGVPLHLLLERAERAYREATPEYEVIKEIVIAWSMHWRSLQLESLCSDPLTQMSTLEHLRDRLEGLFRAARRDGGDVSQSHVLVVIDIKHPLSNGLVAAISALDVSQALRTVFIGDEVIAALTPRRFVVLAERRRVDADCLAIVAVLMRRAAGIPSPHVWIEELPKDPSEITWALDALLS